MAEDYSRRWEVFAAITEGPRCLEMIIDRSGVGRDDVVDELLILMKDGLIDMEGRDGIAHVWLTRS